MQVYAEYWEKRAQEMDKLLTQRYHALDICDGVIPPDMMGGNLSVRNGDLSEEVQRLTMLCAELKNQNMAVKEELSNIHNSRGWRLLCFLYKAKDKLIPRGSRRYRAVKKLLLLKRALFSMNKDRLKKFYRACRDGGIRYAVKKTFGFIERYPNARFCASGDNRTELHAEVSTAANLTEDYRELVFPKVGKPQVSIIIPAYNQWKYTYNCLRSIMETCRGCSYEIIVADDCSEDETAYLERYAKNVRHIRNKENLRFLKNCNNAAKQAKGKYIVFLNNDTCVLDNWLSALVETMERDPNVGMAGSKFIYPDGSLQEAGGIMWSDGTGANYGRGRDPMHAEYNYVKEVDYISGASIIIRNSLWNELGGFDEIYAPAYFEDSDLAFQVRNHGWKVVYQPKSALVHFERVSSSEGENTDAYKLMERNRSKFVEKWSAELARDSRSPFTSMYLQRDRSLHRKSILFIDDRVPMFDQQAGAKTTFNFLQLLNDLGYKITFIGDNDYHPHQPYTEILQQMGVEVIYGQWYMDNNFFWIEQHLDAFSLIFLNRPHIAQRYLKWFKERCSTPIVYYGHDLHFLREYREYELTGDRTMLTKSNRSKQTELDIMRNADIVLTVSPEEKKVIDHELGDEKAVVSPIFFYRGFEEKHIDIKSKQGLLFVGGYGHTPNVDGAKWFCNEILPLIRKAIPDVKLTLAGSHPTPEILEMESESIHVTGYLSDKQLTELYEKNRVCVIPLRFGAGVKGKTVDAMYNRMAIVSTAIGLEGLPGIEEYLKPFNDAESFAAEVVRLYYSDADITEAYKRNIKYIERTFSYDSALMLFEKVFGRGEKE